VGSECLGTSIGVALPTLCTLASSSITVGVLAAVAWTAVSGALSWILFARITLV
jgi:hypothetical protein